MRIRRKTLTIVVPLLLSFAALGIWYLRSDSFQNYVRASVISRIEKATGLNCRIERVEFSVLRGKFFIAGLALSPRTQAPGLVKLNVQEIRASISISSFWHLRIRLGELEILRPRLELISGEDKPSTWDPEGMLKNLKLSLRLEASKVAVQDGWLKVNNHTQPFHLLIENLDCEIRYSKELPSYKVSLEYSRSQIHWEERDIVHGLGLEANVSLQGITIDYFVLRRGNTLLVGSGSVKDWSAPVLQIHTAGNLDARDLNLADPSLYEGRGSIAVIADLRCDKSGVYSKGRFTARSGGYRKMSYSSLAGSYEIQNDVLHFRNTSGKIANGTFLVNGDIQLRNHSKDPSRVIVKTNNVPLIDAGRLLDLPLLNFENTADAATTLTWYGGKELRVDCDATLHGLARPMVGSSRSTLLDGKVRFTYFDSGSVFVETANLSSPYTTVKASGGRDFLFHVQLSTKRISEPFDLIAGFSPPVADLIKSEPDLREMAGYFDVDGDVRIKTSSAIEYRGSLSIQNGRWRSYKADALSTQVVFISPRLELRSIALHSGTQSVAGNLDLELADGEHVSAFKFDGQVHQVALATLRDFGVDTSKLAGSLTGSGHVRFERGSWQGEGQLSVDDGKYDQWSFDSIRAQLLLRDQSFRIIRAEAQRGPARITAEGQVALDSRQLSGTTRLQGFPIETIPLVQTRDIPASGRVSASVVVGGTIDNPTFAGDFELTALRYGSWNLGGGNGRIQFEKETVRGNARIQSEIGTISIQADVATGAGYPGKAVVEFENLDIQKIVTAKAPPFLEDLSTALKGKLEAQGNLEDLASVRIRGEVDGAHFRIHDYELHNAERMRFTIVNQNLLVESVRFVGEGTNLVLSGTVPFNDRSQLDITLNGSLNLELMDGIEKKLHTGGAATLNIRASGSMQDPQVIGQASFHDARLDSRDLPFRFSGMQGDIVFSRNLVRLENVRGSAASGTIQLSGIIEHHNAVPRSMNMSISLRNVHLAFPKDFKTVANADLVLKGSSDFQVLEGDVDVTRMEYVRNFNLLEQLASHGANQSGPLTTEPYLLGLRLNIEIRSDNGLSIDNELTRLRGSMRLTLRGTPAYPSLTGQVEASEGTIFFRGNRFDITRASADFVDRNRINPVLEIRAEAEVQTYRLILDAAGDLDHLNLNITSDPAMSTVDVLSLLTTGKTTDTSTQTSQQESQMAGMSAASMLSENLTGVIGKRVQRILGFESFRVDPFLAGAENDPTARITIGERISKDMVVTFSRNLTTNQEQIVVIEYDVGKNVSVVATRDENGKYGLDFRFRKRLR